VKCVECGTILQGKKASYAKIVKRKYQELTLIKDEYINSDSAINHFSDKWPEFPENSKENK
jgi:hypothetical protein